MRCLRMYKRLEQDLEFFFYNEDFVKLISELSLKSSVSEKNSTNSNTNESLFSQHIFQKNILGKIYFISSSTLHKKSFTSNKKQEKRVFELLNCLVLTKDVSNENKPSNCLRQKKNQILELKKNLDEEVVLGSGNSSLNYFQITQKLLNRLDKKNRNRNLIK